MVKKMNFIKKFIRHSKNTIKMTKTKKILIKKRVLFRINEIGFLLSLTSVLFLDYLKTNISVKIYIFLLVWFNLYIINWYYIKITKYTNLRTHFKSLL